MGWFICPGREVNCIRTNNLYQNLPCTLFCPQCAHNNYPRLLRVLWGTHDHLFLHSLRCVCSAHRVVDVQYVVGTMYSGPIWGGVLCWYSSLIVSAWSLMWVVLVTLPTLHFSSPRTIRSIDVCHISSPVKSPLCKPIHIKCLLLLYLPFWNKWAALPTKDVRYHLLPTENLPWSITCFWLVLILKMASRSALTK